MTHWIEDIIRRGSPHYETDEALFVGEQGQLELNNYARAFAYRAAPITLQAASLGEPLMVAKFRGLPVVQIRGSFLATRVELHGREDGYYGHQPKITVLRL